MKFYTVMPFVPSDPDFMDREYRRFSKSSGLDLLLPSMSMLPEGDNPYLKADCFIAAYAELKRKLAGSGIRLGVLIQSMIGMGRPAFPPTSKFQHTINHKGVPSRRMCPLDPGFQEYCRHVIGSLAELGPELFLLDDDTRLLDNDKLECFCPLHLAEYSGKYDRDELIRLVLEAKPGDPILRESERIRRNTLEQYCRNIRKAIDEADPAIPCGICGASREQIMLERMAAALAGKNEPFIRIGNAIYLEGCTKTEVPRRIWHSNVILKGCGKVKMILDESDTNPHNRYSKSVSGLHTHITNAILHGLRGSKMWIENFFNPTAERPNLYFEEHMREYQGFYTELSRIAENIQWKGPSIPLPDLEKNFHPKEYPAYYNCTEWFSDVLGRLGIPVTFRETDDPQAEAFLLTGALIRELNDSQIKAMTGKNLFLDSIAAEYLAGKGYGNLLGVSLSECPHFNSEYDEETHLKVRITPDADCRKLNPVPEAEILSRLYVSPFTGSAERSYVAPGSVFYDNGKTRTAVWAGTPNIYFTPSPERKLWLLRILKRLADIPAACLNEQDILFRCGLTNEGSLLAAIVNLNYDELTDIELFCAEKPQKISFLAPDGHWEEISFEWHGSNVRLQNISCPACRPLVLQIFS